MGANVTVRIDGLRELGERLKGLKVDMQKRAAWQACGRGASIVKREAKKIVRGNVDAQTSSGSLESAIVAKRVPSGQRRYTAEYWVTARRAKTGRKKAKGKQAVAPHAGFVEFGTVKMAAEPYLRPALANNVQSIGNAMRDKLAKAIAKFSK